MPKLGDMSNDQDAAVFDAITRSKSVEFSVETVRSMYRLHHVTFHLGHTAVENIDAPFVKTTYPAEWVSRYLLKRYFLVDPVVREGFKRRLPFAWDELQLTPEAAELIEDAQKHGVGSYGYSVPVVDKDNRRSLFSITTTGTHAVWENFISVHQQGLAEIAGVIHRQAILEVFGTDHPFPHLSDREVECLALTAQGKDSGDIAIILDLSENTVRSYLKSIRGKLGCSTMAQAVAKAIQHRVISR
jgi:DNA-binding CsgD family transcriptional regulator